MKIGILGVGNIGKTLARKLSAAGHDVKIANWRGPETIEADELASRAPSRQPRPWRMLTSYSLDPPESPARDRAANRQTAGRDGRHGHVKLLPATGRDD